MASAAPAQRLGSPLQASIVAAQRSEGRETVLATNHALSNQYTSLKASMDKLLNPESRLNTESREFSEMINRVNSLNILLGAEARLIYNHLDNNGKRELSKIIDSANGMFNTLGEMYRGVVKITDAGVDYSHIEGERGRRLMQSITEVGNNTSKEKRASAELSEALSRVFEGTNHISRTGISGYANSIVKKYKNVPSENLSHKHLTGALRAEPINDNIHPPLSAGIEHNVTPNVAGLKRGAGNAETITQPQEALPSRVLERIKAAKGGYPRATLERLAKSSDNLQILDALADKSEHLKALVAGNPKISADRLREYANSQILPVLMAVAGNRNTPTASLEELQKKGRSGALFNKVSKELERRKREAPGTAGSRAERSMGPQEADKAA